MKENSITNTTFKYPIYDRCVCCGTIVPEGTMICPFCESHPTANFSTNLVKKKSGFCIKSISKSV